MEREERAQIENLLSYIDSGEFLNRWKKLNYTISFHADHKKIDSVHQASFRILEALKYALKEGDPFDPSDFHYKELFSVTSQLSNYWLEENIEIEVVVSYYVSFITTVFTMVNSPKLIEAMMNFFNIVIDIYITALLEKRLSEQRHSFCENMPLYELNKDILNCHIIGEIDRRGFEIIQERIMEKVMNSNYKVCIIDILNLRNIKELKSDILELINNLVSLDIKVIVVSRVEELKKEIEDKKVVIFPTLKDALLSRERGLLGKLKRLF